MEYDMLYYVAVIVGVRRRWFTSAVGRRELRSAVSDCRTSSDFIAVVAKRWLGSSDYSTAYIQHEIYWR